MSSEKYIGLDVHQATISVAVLDSRGKLVMESIVETKAATILDFFAGLRGTLSVTFEEGTWAAWLYDLLKPHVDKLVVCNPRKNALLKDGNKSDRIDARKLAELLRLDNLKPVYHGETGVRNAARTRPELPDHRQRFDASHESPESVVSQLGDSLCGPGRLLYPPSPRAAGKDPGSRRPPARRATLPATRHAATLAPTSAARTASRESEASHHRQATEDSIARAHSLGLSGGSDPDPASFSHQAPAVGLQWTGVGDPHQRGTPLRPRPTAALQKAGLHPGVEQGSQPRSERPIQSRRYQGQWTARKSTRPGASDRSMVDTVQPPGLPVSETDRRRRD